MLLLSRWADVAQVVLHLLASAHSFYHMPFHAAPRVVMALACLRIATAHALPSLLESWCGLPAPLLPTAELAFLLYVLCTRIGWSRDWLPKLSLDIASGVLMWRSRSEIALRLATMQTGILFFRCVLEQEYDKCMTRVLIFFHHGRGPMPTTALWLYRYAWNANVLRHTVHYRRKPSPSALRMIEWQLRRHTYTHHDLQRLLDRLPDTDEIARLFLDAGLWNQTWPLRFYPNSDSVNEWMRNEAKRRIGPLARHLQDDFTAVPARIMSEYLVWPESGPGPGPWSEPGPEIGRRN